MKKIENMIAENLFSEKYIDAYNRGLSLRYISISNDEIIELLRMFVSVNNMIPTRKSSFGVSVTTCEKKFGSWRRAKMMAGLDQLLAEVKGV